MSGSIPVGLGPRPLHPVFGATGTGPDDFDAKDEARVALAYNVATGQGSEEVWRGLVNLEDPRTKLALSHLDPAARVDYARALVRDLVKSVPGSSVPFFENSSFRAAGSAGARGVADGKVDWSLPDLNKDPDFVKGDIDVFSMNPMDLARMAQTDKGAKPVGARDGKIDWSLDDLRKDPDFWHLVANSSISSEELQRLAQEAKAKQNQAARV